MSEQMEKRCSTCGISKPLDAFRRPMKRGQIKYRHECLDCESAYYRSAEYKKKANSKARQYREEGRYVDRDSKHLERLREVTKQKQRARRLVADAILSGAIKRATECSVCGAPDSRQPGNRSLVQAHHDDYSKPLEVRWLCRPCHVAHHNADRQQKLVSRDKKTIGALLILFGSFSYTPEKHS